MSRENDKEEAAVLAAIMALVNDQLPTIEYMLAENAAGRADREERDRHGESSGLLKDLRGYRENMLDDARSLAESIARLQREVAYATKGRPVPTYKTIAEIFADLGYPVMPKFPSIFRKEN